MNINFPWKNLLYLIGLTLSVFNLHAKSEDNKETKIKSVDQELAEDLESGVLREVLQLEQEEVRLKLDKVLLLGLGQSYSWLGRSLHFKWQDDTESFFQIGIGTHNTQLLGQDDSKTYELDFDSKVFYFANQRFLTDIIPIYLEPYIGIVTWSGKIEPKGTNVVTDSQANSINSFFQTQGISVGGNIGFLFSFAESWVLEFSLFNISTARILRDSFTNNSSEARRNVRDEIQRLVSAGSFNLKIGYMLED